MRGARWTTLCLCLGLAAYGVVGEALLRCATCRAARQEDCVPLLDTSVPQPKTAKKPHVLEAPSNMSNVPLRTDVYFWLRDDARNSSVVLSHLQEENAYAEAVLAPSTALQQQLLDEMLGRLPREESSAPVRGREHWYYSLHSTGMQYRRFCRRRITNPVAAPSEHDVMDMSQPEEVLLDQDELADGHSFFDMAGPTLSFDESLVAYGIDTAGSEVFTLWVKNLTSNKTVLVGSDESAYSPEFRLCAGDFAFLNDNRTLLFTTLTEDTHRADKVWMYDLVTRPTKASRTPDLRRIVRHAPQLLHHEHDEAFHLGLWRSRSEAVLYLRSASDTTHSLLYMPTNATDTGINFTLIAPKVHEHQYLVRDGHGGADGDKRYVYAVIYTPQQRNGQLVAVDLGALSLVNAAADSQGRRVGADPNAAGSDNSCSGAADAGSIARQDALNSSSSGAEGGNSSAADRGRDGSDGAVSHGYWALLQPHSCEVEIVDMTVSTRHLAVLERRNGTLVATAYPLSTDGAPLAALRDGKHFAFDAPSYSLAFGDQGPFSSSLLSVRYSSLTQPYSTFDINMATGNRVLKHQQEVLGFDGSQYLTRLLWATSADGVQVPVSLAYRGELAKLDGSDPLLLEAYGAYGSSFDPEFSASQLSLLDRGFVCAIAHVRGGGELGRYWHADGKLLAKNHTFDDTLAAADFLIKAKYTSADRMALWGRSAGGLTAGASVNRRPDLFKAAILDVPFVDVVTTMSDPALPLTVTEWEEWGNPTTDRAAYDNMLSYSPLDNVAQQPYPHLLLTGGLNDPRVSFWEPAKMAAKVRQLKTSNSSLVLLRTNMAAGHFANSGVEGRLQEQAFKFAFLLQTLYPCSFVPGDRTEVAAPCRGCFAVLVAVATTVALITLVVVLRPSSSIALKWRRLGRRGGHLSSGAEQDDDDDDEGGEGFDTRMYSSHMSHGQAAAAAEAEAERQLQLRQRQLEEEGLSLAAYDAVRDTVRDRLLPIPAPPSAALTVTPPKRRLALSAAEAQAAAGGSIELSQFVGGSRHLPAIVESPAAGSTKGPQP